MSIGGPQSEPYQPETDPFKHIIKGAAQTHRLFSVHWELTHRCNERCTHCYLDVLPPKANLVDELTTDECLSIIDQISALGGLNLSLSGGEIFVRRDWFEIGSYARSKRLLLRLFTNGIAIRPKIADQIADLHPYGVEISLYSVHPEVHERITRVRRSWELTTRAIRMLRERGVRTKIKTPLMRENVFEIDALRALAQELDASFSFDISITPKRDGRIDPLRHQMSYEQLVWLMKKEMDPAVWLDRELPPDYRTCGIGDLGIVIDPYGKVFPCIEVTWVAGDLRKDSLQAIWERREFWDDLRRINRSRLPNCDSCALLQYCTRCHGLALEESGDLRLPALSICQLALARRQALVEKGALPADFPIPEHLRGYLEALQSANAEYA